MKLLPVNGQSDFFIDHAEFASGELRSGIEIDISPLDATFRDSGRAPLHSWFPYLEGYSPRFVEGVRQEFLPKARRILEPFAGSGTTPIVLGQVGVECAYAEANPAMAFVIKTKIDVLSLNKANRVQLSERLTRLSGTVGDMARIADPDTGLLETYVSSFGKSQFFDDESLDKILRLRTINDEIASEDDCLGSCLELAIMASLIPSSRLKRAGDLRFKTARELQVASPCVLSTVRMRLIDQARDIATATEMSAPTRLACATASKLYESAGDGWCGVITSPPYLNGTNYIRNARLELWYQRELRSKADLRRLRDGVITSGINDVDAQTDWRPVSRGVERVVAELERNAYDQRISKMVGGYFRDMEAALLALSASLERRGRMCIDIGDSIYAGVHVATDDLLVEVAEGIGLSTIERVHLRKRISKGGQPVRQQLLVFEK
jgi:hypothetical protein